MAYKYLVRAKLGGFFLEFQLNLPITFESFTLGVSKNSVRFKMERGILDPPVGDLSEIDPDYPTSVRDRRDLVELYEEQGRRALPRIDHDYPVSDYYLDAVVEADDPKQRFTKADEHLALLEALFRLFQPGDIFIRRHYIWEMKEDGTLDLEANFPVDFSMGLWNSLRVKPDPAPPYERPDYELNYQTLPEFADFFDKYWGVVQQRPRPLDVAILRFASSYESGRTLGDRLVDLMIAIEAVFGNSSEVAYKVALRSSCFVYPPGEAREAAFAKIKRIYNERSRILHGDWLDTRLTAEDVDLFEEHTRKAIVRLLDLWHSGTVLDKEDKLDAFIFFRKR